LQYIIVDIFSRANFSTVILLLTLTTSGCQQVQSFSQSLNQQLAPLPQDPLIQVYFNHAESAKYAEAYRHKTRLGDDLEQKIIDTISQAKQTVDVAVQEFRLPRIAQALIEKQKAGVKVRLILENNYARPWSSLNADEVDRLNQRDGNRYREFKKFADLNQDDQITPSEVNQRDALVMIRNAQVPWLDNIVGNSKESHLMHHKFVVVDNQTLIVTSANFTLTDMDGEFTNPDSLGNANNLLKISSPELAQLFTQEFNIMWGNGPADKSQSKFGVQKPVRSPQTIAIGNSRVTVHFSPTPANQPWSDSSNGLIGETLSKAKKSVDLALFVFSEPRLANILEQRHQDDVQIRALIEPEFAFRPYSDALDMVGLNVNNNCAYQTTRHAWSNPITTVGIPILPKGDLLHHKFAVIDQQTVITGSHNWSVAANHSNDETLLIIQNPTVAAHYQREFNRLYTQVRLGIPPRVRTKITKQAKFHHSQICASDSKVS
jgi:phosphatidylserine/phosphatidylglycerophosphate/cardiolipin synthase-like enzyme